MVYLHTNDDNMSQLQDKKLLPAYDVRSGPHDNAEISHRLGVLEVPLKWSF